MSKFTFIKTNGEGLSQCQKCGIVGWDWNMYQVKEFDDKRVCYECKQHIENNTEHLITIKWKGFKPKY